MRMRVRRPSCAKLVVRLVRENLPMDHAPSQRRVYNPIRNLGMGQRAGCGSNKSRNFGTQPTAFKVALAACENCRAPVLDVQAVCILACWSSQSQQPQTGSLESGPNSLGIVHSRLPRIKSRPTKVVRFSFVGQRHGFREGKCQLSHQPRAGQGVAEGLEDSRSSAPLASVDMEMIRPTCQ